MKTWISPKSIYESIEETIPSGKYDGEIQRVLIEESERGTYEFLKGRYSLFEFDTQKRLRLKEQAEEELAHILKQMQNIQSLSSKEVDSLYMRRYNLEAKVRYHEQLHSNLTYIDKIWNQYLVSFRVVVRKFRETKDITYLRKGAHVLGEYRDYLLKDTEIETRKQLLIEVLREQPEFDAQLDLASQPLLTLVKLHDLLKESRRRPDTPRFLAEAIVYWKTNWPTLFETGTPVEGETPHVEWDSPDPREEETKPANVDVDIGDEEQADEEAEAEDYLYRSVKWSSGK